MIVADVDAARIFQKLEDISSGLAVLNSQMPDASKRLDDHERRLRTLEARLWMVAGALVLLSFGIPLALRYLIGY